MASLRTLLRTKQNTALGSSSQTPFEENLQKGRVFFFNPGLQSAGTDHQTFCWQAPANGRAIMEIWGASGSGALMCCCGAGIPGNPGAYSLKYLDLSSGDYVCGLVGGSCGNSGTICFRGCSQATCVCYSTVGGSGIVCAMGGRGGISFCTTDPGSPYCCFIATGLCGFQIGGNCCGLICHWCNNGGQPPVWIARACGGDINKDGGFSCAMFFCERSNAPCCYQYYIATSPGVYAEDGAVITYQMEHDSVYSLGPGNGIHQFQFAIASTSRTPDWGMPLAGCWNGSRACGCYESHGCVTYMPHGVPGLPPHPCAGVRDHAIRGGHGAVRIQFIGS